MVSEDYQPTCCVRRWHDARVTATRIEELVTPALLVDADAFEHNLSTMATALPGPRLRPHVKAHKCTALARRQLAAGHHTFTCATIREVEGMAAAGLGEDLLLANEVLDASRLGRLDARVTVAVDSLQTIEAAAKGGVKEVLIDVNVGLPRCGCAPENAGALAEMARTKGLVVRGVMGYEGHAVGLLNTWANEIQAGSYALMDASYAKLGLPFKQAASVLATVISTAAAGYAVANCGLKGLGMDHGNPDIAGGGTVMIVSDEHITFIPESSVAVGDQIRILPAHVDPTVAYHERMHLVRDGEVLETWEVDLRGW